MSEQRHPCPGADLWILAGQSNMEGCGPFTKDYQSHERLWAFDLDHQWAPAIPPLHHLFLAKAPVHRTRMLGRGASPEWMDKLLAGGRAATPRRAGPGYFFGIELLRHLPANKTIALLPAAHGGTALEEWDPSPPAEPGTTMYSSMMQQIEASGLKPTGMLWYQGESDATPKFASTYLERFETFVRHLRADLASPDLPVYTVQIGCMPGWPEPPEYVDAVREAQRRAAESIPNVYLTTIIDGDLCDQIHIDAESQVRLGRRLARQVLATHYGLGGMSDSPRLRNGELVEFRFPPVRPYIEPLLHYKVLLHFDNVSGGLRALGKPSGFKLEIGGMDAAPAGEAWRIDLDADGPGTVSLRLPPNLRPGATVKVGYGCGLNPICNITDGADMPLPCFNGLTLVAPAVAGEPVAPDLAKQLG